MAINGNTKGLIMAILAMIKGHKMAILMAMLAIIMATLIAIHGNNNGHAWQ